MILKILNYSIILFYFFFILTLILVLIFYTLPNDYEILDINNFDYYKEKKIIIRPMDTYLIKDNNFNINKLITIENKLKMNKFNVNENKVIKINNNNCSCKIINESNLEMIIFIKTFYRK